MTKGEEFFDEQIKFTRTELENISVDKFDNPTDFIFKKASIEAAAQAYQNCLVEYRKNTAAASSEEAAIIMHLYCKGLSDKHRIELGTVEQLVNQEDEKIIADRGRLNGLIDAYNKIRVYHDQLTSQHAALHERAKLGKK